jgi:membrane associated rhomboid family serine protease
VSIFRSSSRWPCEEQALVLKAMSIEHRVTEQPDGCHLLVPADSAVRATEQLGLYKRENPRRAATPWPAVEPSRGAGAAACWVLALLSLYQVQARYLGGIDWLAAGQLVAGRVRGGEWWLGVTALTLHADAAHVAGNMAFGAFFGYLAGQYLGSGVAWLAIVWLASAGNVANAFLQSDWHRSVGASTAVFAALGLVASFVWGIARHHYLGWARRWAPLVGAVALLAYIGTGDERTDIVAHLAGFLAGVGGGFLLYRVIGPCPPAPAVQTAAGFVAVLTVVLCWYLALSNG